MIIIFAFYLIVTKKYIVVAIFFHCISMAFTWLAILDRKNSVISTNHRFKNKKNGKLVIVDNSSGMSWKQILT